MFFAVWTIQNAMHYYLLSTNALVQTVRLFMPKDIQYASVYPPFLIHAWNTQVWNLSRPLDPHPTASIFYQAQIISTLGSHRNDTILLQVQS